MDQSLPGHVLEEGADVRSQTECKGCEPSVGFSVVELGFSSCLYFVTLHAIRNSVFLELCPCDSEILNIYNLG